MNNIWDFHFIDHKYVVPCAMWFCPREATWYVSNQNRSHCFMLCNFHKTLWPDVQPWGPEVRV